MGDTTIADDLEPEPLIRKVPLLARIDRWAKSYTFDAWWMIATAGISAAMGATEAILFPSVRTPMIVTWAVIGVFAFAIAIVRHDDLDGSKNEDE